MSEWMIIWRHPERFTWDVECYENEAEANAALADFAQKYPWNTYSLAEVKREQLATRKWEPPMKFIPTPTTE